MNRVEALCVKKKKLEVYRFDNFQSLLAEEEEEEDEEERFRDRFFFLFDLRRGSSSLLLLLEELLLLDEVRFLFSLTASSTSPSSNEGCLAASSAAFFPRFTRFFSFFSRRFARFSSLLACFFSLLCLLSRFRSARSSLRFASPTGSGIKSNPAIVVITGWYTATTGFISCRCCVCQSCCCGASEFGVEYVGANDDGVVSSLVIHEGIVMPLPLPAILLLFEFSSRQGPFWVTRHTKR